METKKENDEISVKQFLSVLHDWIRYLLSKWLVIISLGILGGMLGLCYAWFKKPIYTATTTFVLEDGDKQGGLGQYAGLASMVGIDLGGGGGGLFQGENIIELYKSRTMVEETLLSRIEYNGGKHLLIDRYIEFNKLRQSWSSNAKLKDIDFNLNGRKSFTRLQDSILGLAVKDIKANNLFVSKPDKKLSIIRVDIKSKDELFSKMFNDQIVKNVNDFYVRTKTKKSLQNVQILQQKVDSVRAVMNGAIFTVATIVDATPNLNASRQAQRAAPMQRSQFSAETNKLILGELVKNLELSKISLRKETPLVQELDHPIYPLEKDKLGKLKGIIIGGILMSLLTVFALIARRFFKKIYS
jgi:Uncharacterized protein involved in exopolysaccharide biosynthesis